MPTTAKLVIGLLHIKKKKSRNYVTLNILYCDLMAFTPSFRPFYPSVISDGLNQDQIMAFEVNLYPILLMDPLT